MCRQAGDGHSFGSLQTGNAERLPSGVKGLGQRGGLLPLEELRCKFGVSSLRLRWV